MTDTITRRRPERRALTMKNIEVRAAADDTTSAGTIAGYAIVYGAASDDLGGWREIIMPGACTDVLATSPDVRFLINHEGVPLGRTSAGTLRLKEDKNGLAFEVDLPAGCRAEELVQAIERGDITQCSFRFVVEYEDREWVYPADDQPLRQINKISELWDVCLVTFPAYPSTTAGMRSLDDTPIEIPANPADLAHIDLRRRQLRRERRA